jgi:hypothetical protein
MDDLVQVNRNIAQFWLGRLDARQEEYLSHAPVCLGELICSAAELAQVLAASKQARTDRLRILELNRRYLQFARLAAKDVAGGRLEMLIRLGLNLEQSTVLSQLTNDDVALLALLWQGPIVRFDSRSFRQGTALHAGAAQQHARAVLATRPPLNHSPGS